MTTKEEDKTMILPGGVLNTPLFRRVRSWPIWGGSWSYLVVETDTGHELDCIRAFRVIASPDKRVLALRQYLSDDQLFPNNLRDMILALQASFPPSDEDNVARHNIYSNILSTKAIYHGTEAEFEVECRKSLMVFDWERILKVVPSDTKDMLAAWNRMERDQIYDEISEVTCLSSTTRWYINTNIVEIRRQEDRWRGTSSMGIFESILFWIWSLLLILCCVIPEVVSFYLLALLALIRSLPTRPQALATVLAIVDFPFADEKLARLTLFQRFLGVLISVIFGIKATFDPKFHNTAFRGFQQIWWKALLSIFWQMSMQNWKNVLDVIMKVFIQRNQLSIDQITKIKEKVERLEVCNAYNFSWFETYNQGNRFRPQVSFHKQEQGDILTILRWATRFNIHRIPNDDFFNKFSILVGTMLIGGVICASTFPVDPYAGLIALAYYSNIIPKIGLDTWDSSQSYDDVLRFFTVTIGPTFPTTIVLVVNLIWWIVNGTGVFQSMDIAFWVVLVALFIISLYFKLWVETFNRFGFWLRMKFMKKITSSDAIV